MNLPLDVWANVARFLPSGERVSMFFALRKAMLIPYQNSVHETLLYFLDQSRREDVDTDDGVWPTVPTWDDDDELLLLEMGFDQESIRESLTQHGGRVDLVLHHLLL